MDTRTGLLEFIKEFFARFPLKTPQFFQYFQYAGILAMGLGLVPDALHWLEITPTPLFSKVITKLLEFCGLITWIMAKLPVENSTKVAMNTNKMPFTKAHKLKKDTNVITK